MAKKNFMKSTSVVLSVLILCLGLMVVGVNAAEQSILRWAIDWPTVVDPAYSYCFSDMQAAVNLYSPFVYPKPEGGVDPHVAESWKVSNDGLLWTFQIKPGVFFSDGTELLAEDVKFSMDRLLTIGAGFSYLFKGSIKSTEVVDDYTVVFHTKEPFGPFLAALTKFYVMNKDEVMAHAKADGKYGEFGDYGEEWLVTHSAGAGPYMVKEFITTDYLLMEKNPYCSFYIAPRAADLVKMISSIEPATVQTLMRNRELEISDFWQTSESFEVMATIPDVEVIGFDVGRAGFFTLNTSKSPTDDVHFRRAICYAFDYEAALTLFPGSKQPRGPVPHVIPGWNPDTFQYQLDLEKAKEELAKSKYAGDLTEYPVEIEYWMPSPDNEKMALLLLSNLVKLGVESFLSPTPIPRALDMAASKEATPSMMFFEIACEYPEAGAILSLHLHSQNTGRYENTTWLDDPEIDALIDKAIATIDPQERYALYYEIQDRAAELATEILPYDRFERHAVQSYIDWPQSRNPYPATGFNLDARFIEVYPEKRAELLGK